MRPFFKRTCYTLAILLAWVILPSFSSAQTTGFSGTGGNIDVIYQRCNWRINPDSAIKAIGGSVLMRFTTTQNNVTSISFDLNSALTISKIVFRGVNRPAASISRSGNIVTLALGVTLANNYTDEIDIFYNGTPPSFSTYGEGYQKNNLSVAGSVGNVIYTLAESYGDEDWWPCKADMQDKIDSIDFIISMPSAFRAATSGVLVSEVVSGADRIMTYMHRYPIASYLVSVGVAQYTVFDRGTVNINGTNVPVVYYIYTGRGGSASKLTAMDFCKLELVAFSNKYGDYPFKNEKYGMYEFGWGGGMEHQTMSSMDYNAMGSWSIIAHELAHQWFGDKVTFSTWNHLWLAEGFAKYSEVLAAELVPTLGQSAVSHRAGIKTTAISTSTTPIYLSAASIANSNTIWTTANDNAIYRRGAMVVSMLRKLAGDTKFFEALRNYLSDPALSYRSATTDDLKNHFEAVLNYDLDPFFNDYIYGTGNPAYTIRWGNNGTRFNLQVFSQSKNPAASPVAYFRSPVVVKVSNGVVDTTIVFYDQNGKLSYAGNGISMSYPRNTLAYKLSFVPTTVTYDPDSETLTTGSVTKDNSLNNVIYNTLPIDIIDFSALPKEDHNQLILSIVPTSEKKIIEAEKSENGIDFYSLGSMTQTESTQAAIIYQYHDKSLQPLQTYYYRVKTIDETGAVKYSKIIRIASQHVNSGVRISPNPGDKQVLIQWTQVSGNNSTAEIKLLNMSGQLLWIKKTMDNHITVNTSTMPVGTYLVQIKQNNEAILNKKLIIRR